MKALTLHQPWASLVACGAKSIETRSWSTSYRGPLAIHAGKSTEAYRPDCEDSSGRPYVMHLVDLSRALRSQGFDSSAMHGPLGAVVATCRLVDVVPTDTMAGFARIAGLHRGMAPVDPATWLDEHEPACDYGGVVWDLEANRPFGNFTPGRFAWLLADVEPVDPPVPARGRQQLWEWAA